MPDTDRNAAINKEKKHYTSKVAANEAGFVFQDGKVNWLGYIDHLNSQRFHGGKPLYDKEKNDKFMDKVARRNEAMDQEFVARVAHLQRGSHEGEAELGGFGALPAK
ncbi:hypothetical protein E2562_010535 [Oryza meyeriana var. granulata]|uniref:Cathepsin propeptide inhibitor domain-containing protein n=1 Tax=Oryza meyeriana var. granulata TaxID=110450 RepID=A0A6G1BU58_9ORYZ|nr:hypothetical protein E2562_010535 [Oryza meyeriana var. granulata]